MTTYAIGIEFIGTRYYGWQRQQNVPSVQQALENAFGRVADHDVEIVAAGRTDAGVHASNMIAHFVSDAKRSPYNWLRGVNTLLPNDIALRWLTPMSDDFHARFRAKRRRYMYLTLNQKHRPGTLFAQVTHHYNELDGAKMARACRFLLGERDFSAFRAAACQSRQPVRRVYRADFLRRGPFLVLDIEADGFLHHMVRNVMGALFAIGEGQLPENAIDDLLRAKNRALAPPTASANGLYFVDATYDPAHQERLPPTRFGPLGLDLPK